MKKLIFIFSLIIGFGKIAYSQEVATDFNVADCNGEMHHLFDELDAGKVVVMAWVMPCASCIADPAYAFSLSETYANTHPDKVIFYLVDDYADTNCSTLQSWAANFGMGKSTIFSNEAIKMSDYGEDGMPKIVVLGGGAEHKVYYNKNFTSEGIDEAIEYAISQSTATDVHEIPFMSSIESFPNPAAKVFNVQFTLEESAEISTQILNSTGESVLYFPPVFYEEGIVKSVFDISDVPNGVYFLLFKSDHATKAIKFNVAH
jgi:hypothetical protein